MESKYVNQGKRDSDRQRVNDQKRDGDRERIRDQRFSLKTRSPSERICAEGGRFAMKEKHTKEGERIGGQKCAVTGDL